jgi:CheY-like chemotaxis protein
MVTILIVEDDELMARLYRKVFNFEGFQVELAGDGQAGLDKAREIKPNLILLDVMMPRLNGLDALTQLKADPTTKDIPVVMLTNLAGQQDAEQAIAKGAVKYIVKSENDPQGVAGIVKSVLAAPGGSAPAPGAHRSGQPQPLGNIKYPGDGHPQRPSGGDHSPGITRYAQCQPRHSADQRRHAHHPGRWSR